MKRWRFALIPSVLIGWWLVSALRHPCPAHWGAFFSVFVLGAEVLSRRFDDTL